MNTDATVSRVLMTADTIGGVWTFALELCRGLAPFGVHVMLATMGPAPRPEQRLQVSLLKNVTLRESTFALEWMDDPWADVARAGEWLWTLEEEFHPDVIHLNGFAHAALPWNTPTIVTAHSCVLSWFRSVKGQSAPASWYRYEEMVRTGLHAANMVTGPTRWMVEQLIHFYGPLPAVRIIANGRNPIGDSTSVKEPFALSVGRLWDEAKNIALLQKIAPDIRWPIRLAGENTSPDGEHHPCTNLHLLGPLAEGELAAWYARAAIYVLPALYEPFGLSVLEAAQARCALVLSDIPSLRETWEGAALFVPPDDANAFRAALTGLMENSDEQNRLASLAHARAQDFTGDRMARNYRGLYLSLIAQDELLPETVPFFLS